MNMPKLTPVVSSNVLEMGYDDSLITMFVKFKSGTYAYIGVTKDAYEKILKAPSIGKALNASGLKGIKV